MAAGFHSVPVEEKPVNQPTTKSGKPLSKQQMHARNKVERGCCRICTRPIPGRPELWQKIPVNKIARIFTLDGHEVVGRKTSAEEITTADGLVVKIDETVHNMLSCAQLLGQLCMTHKKAEREAIRKKKGIKQRHLYAPSYGKAHIDPAVTLRNKLAEEADSVRQARLRAESPSAPDPKGRPWEAKFSPAPKRKPKQPGQSAKPPPTSLSPPE